MTKNAVILLSGGLDSATVLAIARNQGFQCHALSFRYGQRHSIEIESAKNVARSQSAADHKIIDIDLTTFGHSALTDPAIKVPKDQPGFNNTNKIPSTYVPARNTIFLSYALAWAEVLNSSDIFIGVNAADYSGYPDCRPEFIAAFEHMANLATAAAVEGKTEMKINTPIIEMSKAQIISTGTELGVDYSLTRSCYDPDTTGRACGKCDSCKIRLAGFEQANLKDPIEYISEN